MCGFGLTTRVAMEVNAYLWVEGVVIHREVMWRHKRSLQTLEWTCARLDWYLADDSSEELALDDQPMLWSLRHVCLQSSSFSRSCFHRGEPFCDRTLLNAIYAYITPGFTDDAAGYHASRVEPCVPGVAADGE